MNVLAIPLTYNSLLWCRYLHPSLQLLLCTAHSVAQSCSTHLSLDAYGLQLSVAINTDVAFRHTENVKVLSKVETKDRKRIRVTPHKGLVIAVVGGDGWNGSLGLLLFSNLIAVEEFTQLLHTNPNKHFKKVNGGLASYN